MKLQESKRDLLNMYDYSVENQRLREAIGKAISGLSTVHAMFNSPQMDNSHVRRSIEEARHVQRDLILAQKAIKDNSMTELKKEVEELKKKLKECGKYAKIIKVGLDKNDARFLEAEQIERIVKKELEK